MKHIKQSTFTTFLLIGSIFMFGQTVTINPFIGMKSGITKKYFYDSYYRDDLHLYTSHNVRIINPFLIPINFGFTADYRKKEHCFSLGLILNDGAESLVKVSSGKNQKVFSNFHRVPVNKISFDYSYTLFEKFKTVENIKEKKYSVSLFTGINYNMIKAAPSEYSSLGISYGNTQTVVSPNNDTITLQPFSTQNPYQKNYFSCKIGTSLNIYRKSNKLLATLTLFYEQGIRSDYKITGGSGYFITINNKNSSNYGLGSDFSPTRGSNIQLRLSFPIQIYSTH